MERNPNSKTLWGWGVGKNTKNVDVGLMIIPVIDVILVEETKLELTMEAGFDFQVGQIMHVAIDCNLALSALAQGCSVDLR